VSEEETAGVGENHCVFKAFCHMSHNVTDETCGYHLVNKVVDCPLYKFAVRVHNNGVKCVVELFDDPKSLNEETIIVKIPAQQLSAVRIEESP
jgi:hypothetical protein